MFVIDKIRCVMGNAQRPWKWWLFGGLAVLMLLWPTKGQTQASAEPTLQPVQPVVQAGQQIAFVGSGFVPGEDVGNWVTTANQTVLSNELVSADRLGKVYITFDIVDDALTGRWAMTARGSISQLPVVAFFAVEGLSSQVANVQASVDPSVGPAGTQFTFVATGFRKEEPVSYWVTGPDNQIYTPFHTQTRANKDRQAEVIWESPTDALAGTWVMTMQGYKSEIKRAIPFEITEPVR
ncbi:MAG: hypothetical protein HC837_14465 [Chloroflexaceae bacterium]|nr:hypothetical protein [Chloroflexaceae bacterium]